MDFSIRSFGNTRANQGTIVCLSQNGLEMLKEILDDKKRYCFTHGSSQIIAENTIFTKFVKNSLQRCDEKAGELSEFVISLVVKEYLDKENEDILGLRKIIAEAQLKELQMGLNLPKNIQEQLDSLLFEHVSVNPESFPLDSRLLNFLSVKIPSLLTHFSKESLEKYITLTFYSCSASESMDCFMLEILKNLESIKTEIEISQEIIQKIKKNICFMYNYQEKLRSIMITLGDFNTMIEKITKSTRMKWNKISNMVNDKVLDLVEGLLQESQHENSENEENSLKTLEEIKVAVQISQKIMLEKIRIIEDCEIELEKFENLEKIMDKTTEDQIISDKNKIKEEILRVYQEPDQIERRINEIKCYDEKRQKNMERIREINEEQLRLHEIYWQKTAKVKKTYEAGSGIEILLRSDFCEYESAVFLKERELVQKETELKIKSERFELEKTRKNKENSSGQGKSFSFLDKLAFNGIFLMIGVLTKIYIIG